MLAFKTASKVDFVTRTKYWFMACKSLKITKRQSQKMMSFMAIDFNSILKQPIMREIKNGLMVKAHDERIKQNENSTKSFLFFLMFLIIRFFKFISISLMILWERI
jgi:hypothetical protein